MADTKATSAITIVDMSDSRSITAVDVEYYQSTSSSSLVGGSWSTTAPTWVNGQYIWSKVKTTYSSGDPTYTDAVCITGQAGQTGEIGRGVASIVGQYAISSSKTVAPSDTSFSTEMPTWTPGNYIWSRSLITYTSGSPATSTTTPVVSSEWEAVNGIEIGGRNLFQQSNLRNWADTSNAIGEDSNQRSFFAKVDSNQTYSLSRSSLSNNRFRYYLLTEEPYVGMSLSGLTNNHDSDLKIEGFKTNSDTEYVLVYLTDQDDDLPDIKLERGNKATDWTPAPEDVQAQIDGALDVAKNKSEIIFAAEYADRGTLLPLDVGTLVFFSNQKQTYRYEGYIEGAHEWNDVTYDLVGPLAGDLSNLQTQLGTRAIVFTRATAPTVGENGEAKAGDMWINTSDSNKVYILFGGSWTLFNQSEFDSVQDILDNITKTMTGGSTIWRQDTQPASGMVNGDLWFNTTSGMNNQCKKYNGSSWVLFDFTTLLSYVETKSDSWKNADELYGWIKDSEAYQSALESKLDTSVYNTVIAPMINKIPGMESTLSGWSQLEAAVNTAAANDIDLYNKLNAYNVYLEYQPATPGQPNSDYLKIARRDPTTGIRSGFEIRITNDEIGFFLTRTDGSGNIIGTDKLAYANGLEFRMVNATVTKQINLIPTEAPLGAAGGQQYFQLLATTDGAFQGLWVTDT